MSTRLQESAARLRLDPLRWLQCTALAFTAAVPPRRGELGVVGARRARTVTGTLSANVRPPDPSKVIVRAFCSPGAAVYL